MQQPSKITEYLEAVRQQIRWKRAQPPVLEEINNHITDQKNAFVSEGLNEEAATDKAIAEMGDPIVVGEQLDRAHRPRPDWPLFVMTATMLLLGLAVKFFNYGAVMFQEQIIWSGIAILVMFVAYFLDFTIIGKYPRIVFFALCAITLASCLFTEEIQATSTIYLLLLFPTAFAGFVYKMRNEGYGGLILCGAAFIIPAYLVVLDPIVPSLTVPFLICTSCLIILTVAVEKGWFNVRKLFAILIMYISTAVVLSTSFIMTMGEGEVLKRMQEHWLSYLFTAFGRNTTRAQVMMNSLLDPTGVGYIRTTIQQFLSHSKFIGEGLPISDYGGYPASQLLAANTDFLLTYMIYRLGWIVLIGIIAIFTAFIIRAVLLCKKQKGVLGLLVSIAIISTFAVQLMSYIAFNLGFLLLSPVSLPLISHGGRALVTNMFLIGFLLSVFRTGNLVTDKAGGISGKIKPLNTIR